MSGAGMYRALRAFTCVAVLGGVAAVVPACEVGVEGADYPVAYGGGYPDGCIATTDAVYYNGYPSYYCGGYWYFRGEGGRWGHYDREPRGLYQRRIGGGGGGVVRRNYEPGARGGVRGGGGGGRGGGGGHGGGGHR
ncbi:MAG: hypothetical protein ACLQVI_31390 [Polyangiaceae bacterium]|jgi:hypothetical protein